MRHFRCILTACILLTLLTAYGCGASEHSVTDIVPTSAAETENVPEAIASQTDAEPSAVRSASASSGFTLEDLQRENELTNLVRAYGRVRVRGFYNEEPTGETNYFWHNDRVVSAQKSIFEGEPYYSGTFGDVAFEQIGDRLQGNYSLDRSGTPFNEADVTSMLLTGEIRDLTDQGDRWTFRILPERADVYEKAECRCIAEKETLALDEVTLTLENGDVVRHTIEHSPSLDADDFGLLDGLEKPFRTVRICSVLHDETGRETFDSVTVDVPYNLELIPTLDREVSLYLNETLTKEYIYPGNGKNYTVYITDAMG